MHHIMSYCAGFVSANHPDTSGYFRLRCVLSGLLLPDTVNIVQMLLIFLAPALLVFFLIAWYHFVRKQFDRKTRELGAQLNQIQSIEEGLKKSNRRLEILNRIIHDVNSASSPGDISRALAMTLREAMPVDAFFIDGFTEADSVKNLGNYDTINGQFQLVPPVDFNTRRMSGVLNEHLMIEKKPVIIFRTQAETKMDNRFVHFGIKDRSSASLVFVPMVAAGQVIGIFSVQSYRSNAYSGEDIDLLQEVAAHIAPVVHNFLLLWQMEEESAELLDSRDRLRNFIEGVRDMVYFRGRDGNITMLNRAIVRIAGFSDEEINLQPELWRSLVNPSDLVSIERFLAALPEGGDFAEFDYRINTRDGAIKWILSNMSAVRGLDNRIIGYNCIDRDISDIRRVEENLRASEEQLDAIIEQSPLGIQILSPDGKTLVVNREWCRIWGIPEDQLEEFSLLSDSRITGSEVYETIKRGLGGEAITIPDFQFRKTDPPASVCRLRLVFQAVRDIGGELRNILIIHEDVTEASVQAERQKDMLERAHLSQKIDSLGVLTGGIAHDLNNFISGILGNADLALLTMGPDSQSMEHIHQIITIARHVSELAGYLLAYSGKGRFAAQSLDVNRLVQEMTDLLKISISKQLSLVFHLAPSIPTIEGDITQIRQVLVNLITNASDAIGNDAGTITVSTGMIEADRRYLDYMCPGGKASEGPHVFIEVSDNGSGMDEKTRQRIFDPFFTTRPDARGLGLAVVLGIVLSHGGAIAVQSAPGRGSTFRVLFPCRIRALQAESDDPVPKYHFKSNWRGTGDIMVVDDDECIRDVTRSMLEQFGFSVVSAVDGREALEMFRAKPSGFDLVILDLAMPRMGGEETFHEMRTIRPDLRVILTSGFNDQEASQRYEGKGLAGFLQKPFRVSTLIEKVCSVLTE